MYVARTTRVWHLKLDAFALIRPLRGLAVKALRGMPPTLFNRPVLFTNRGITRCLGHAGDRQIFDSQCPGRPGLLNRVGGMPRKR